MPCVGSSHLWFSGEVALLCFQAPAVMRSIDRGHEANDFPFVEDGRSGFAKVDDGPPLPTSPEQPYCPRHRILAVGRGFQSSDLYSRYMPPAGSPLSQTRN